MSFFLSIVLTIKVIFPASVLSISTKMTWLVAGNKGLAINDKYHEGYLKEKEISPSKKNVGNKIFI